MRATVIQIEHRQQKNVVADYQKKLDEFLATPINGKIPEVKFITQSEFSPMEMGGVRAFVASNPHITCTILWE
jgi:hypothetical protein